MAFFARQSGLRLPATQNDITISLATRDWSPRLASPHLLQAASEMETKLEEPRSDQNDLPVRPERQPFILTERVSRQSLDILDTLGAAFGSPSAMVAECLRCSLTIERANLCTTSPNSNAAARGQAAN